MATKVQPASKTTPASRERDLGYASEDVSGPLMVVLSAIAFVLLASFVYSLDWHYESDLPAMTETLPSTAPATPPSTS